MMFLTTDDADFSDGRQGLTKCLRELSSVLYPTLAGGSFALVFNLCVLRNLWFTSLFFCISVAVPIRAQDIQKLSLPLIQDITRADLYIWSPIPHPKGVLVLIPGTNGNGEGLICQAEWQEYARDHHLALIGVSFASPEALLVKNRGYYYASQGSGQLLLNGIQQAFRQDLPILLFGFSAGAMFSSRFVEWQPERVVTWCAYSAGWWDDPIAQSITPPGIVACGGDDNRLGASLIYFKKGRALGRPWLWLELPNTGHSCPPAMSQFARNYFTTILSTRGTTDPNKDGIWVDIDRRTKVPKESEHPTVMAWLPTGELFKEWRKLNTP